MAHPDQKAHDSMASAALVFAYSEAKDERSKHIVRIADSAVARGTRQVLDAVNALALARSDIDGPVDEKTVEAAEERLLRAWEAGLS